jgi:hypothetical protein
LIFIVTRFHRQTACALAAALLSLGTAGRAVAQRHNGRSSPATAPVAPPAPVAAPVVAVSSGLGAIQFVQVNYGVPAPQSLTRQLRFDDDRTRAAALSAVGAPGQYLTRGHIPMPRSIELQLVPLSNNADELDALLTVELDQHLVTAVLVPVDGNWKRVATLLFPTNFYDTSTTPDTWLHIARALVQPNSYRAIFRASSGSMNSNFTENEAHLRIINGRAVINISFESTGRDCGVASSQPAHPNDPKAPQSKPTGCNVLHRWFQSEPADPTHHFELITGSGRLNAKDLADPYSNSHTVLLSHLRTFTCQPFIFNESAQRFDPAAANGACKAK